MHYFISADIQNEGDYVIKLSISEIFLASNSFIAALLTNSFTCPCKHGEGHFKFGDTEYQV